MYCSQCGSSLEATAHFCPYCGMARDGRPPLWQAGQLVRPRSSRMIAGVCAGFAEHYGWDLGLVRLFTVVITLLTGVAVFAYLAAWIILPEGQYTLPTSSPPAESTPH